MLTFKRTNRNRYVLSSVAYRPPILRSEFMRIPVTVITGFLGSGKTTFINQLLKQEAVPLDQIAIIVNEFGEIGIDHQLILDVEEEIIQLNNGCVCCSLRKDLVATLHALASVFSEEQLPLRHVLIETTGLANPASIIQTIENTPIITDYFFLDGVITVVDCANFQQTVLKYEEVNQQIAVADRIILAKTEQTLHKKVQQMQQQLNQLNPLADFLAFTTENQPFLATSLQLNRSKPMNQHQSQPEEAHHHHEHHADSFHSLTLKTTVPLKKQPLQLWLDWLLLSFNTELYRYKGLLLLSENEKQERLALQGIHTHYQFDLLPKENSFDESTIVLIGKNLAIQKIQDSFDHLVQCSTDPSVA